MNPETFSKYLTEVEFYPFMGIPCSVFKSLINFIESDKTIKNYLCSSEGEAMGLAGGFALSGRIPVVYMQNDGYGNAINPLSSLHLLYKLPSLLLISWRGEPDKKDAPQHIVMGKTILTLLETFDIPYVILEDNIQVLQQTLKKAREHFQQNSTPFALIIRKGYFEDFVSTESKTKKNLAIRLDYLKILDKFLKSSDILLGTTGFSGRELYLRFKQKNKFYMMGSMGCIAAIGLGIAQTFSQRNIFVIDGDGALLMKMGTLSTIGHYKPKNFIHLCFDNQEYESTGGQATCSSTINFIEIARASGYETSRSISDIEQFNKLLTEIDQFKKPLFIHIRIKSGTMEKLARPSESPEEMKTKFMNHLK